MNIDDIVDKLNAGQNEEIETTKTTSEVLRSLIGTACRYMSARHTREDALFFVLTAVFYFFQRERPLTEEDEDTVLRAVRAAIENAGFCNAEREEE